MSAARFYSDERRRRDEADAELAEMAILASLNGATIIVFFIGCFTVVRWITNLL